MLHLLTDEQKKARVTVAKNLLKMYPKYSTKDFDNIVTGDEAWVYYLNQSGRLPTEYGTLKMTDAQVLPNEYER